ncbi:hypothetical protein JKG47_12380 [Acidithiobacillus sp. MC6.1]|nr:hypothetical protein [Acidithiobacillus sp. MC6.1]
MDTSSTKTASGRSAKPVATEKKPAAPAKKPLAAKAETKRIAKAATETAAEPVAKMAEKPIEAEMPPVKTPKKYARRTPEERIAELERQREEIAAKLKEKMDAIDEKRRRLVERPAARKERLEHQKRFELSVLAIAPDWEYAHMIAAIELALAHDLDDLLHKGEALLEKHGKSRRGGKIRKS